VRICYGVEAVGQESKLLLRLCRRHARECPNDAEGKQTTDCRAYEGRPHILANTTTIPCRGCWLLVRRSGCRLRPKQSPKYAMATFFCTDLSEQRASTLTLTRVQMQGPRTAMAFAPAAALRRLSTQLPASYRARQAAAQRPRVLTVRSMCGPSVPAEKTEEEKATIKAEREARKAAKEEEQRQKKADKEAKAKAEAEIAAAALAELRKPVSYHTSELPERVCGDYEVIQSRGLTGRTWADMSKLGEEGGAQV